MRTFTYRLSYFATCALLCGLVTADEIPDAIALPVPVEEAIPVEVQAEVTTPSVQCKHPKVTYRHAHALAKASRCKGRPIDTLLIINDRCSSCCVAVPVCIPSCCLDEACTAERKGLLGRRVIQYTWKCGFKLEVVMRLRGDVIVRYTNA